MFFAWHWASTHTPPITGIQTKAPSDDFGGRCTKLAPRDRSRYLARVTCRSSSHGIHLPIRGFQIADLPFAARLTTARYLPRTGGFTSSMLAYLPQLLVPGALSALCVLLPVFDGIFQAAMDALRAASACLWRYLSGTLLVPRAGCGTPVGRPA